MTRHAIGNLICFRTGAIVLALLIANRGASQTLSMDGAATELVRQTVALELAAANAGGHYMYRFHEETPEGSETREMVETREWLIGRLIRKNGLALPPAQRQREDERLRGLLSNRGRLIKLQKKQRYDEARVRKTIKAFPAAFLYQSAGTERDSAGGELTRLTFRPNPAFTPPSMELRVLGGMEGTMLIDPEAKRLWRVEAKLFQDVNFGWGLLGQISSGGTFLFEQRGVGHDRWAITTLTMNYTNKRLLLFTSHVNSVQKASNFRRMPDDLTLQQGLELLLNQDQMTATKQDSPSTVKDRVRDDRRTRLGRKARAHGIEVTLPSALIWRNSAPSRKGCGRAKRGGAVTRAMSRRANRPGIRMEFRPPACVT